MAFFSFCWPGSPAISFLKEASLLLGRTPNHPGQTFKQSTFYRLILPEQEEKNLIFLNISSVNPVLKTESGKASNKSAAYYANLGSPAPQLLLYQTYFGRELRLPPDQAC